METNNYTTVNISKTYQKLLKSQAQAKGYSQVQYLEKCLYWFKISGMDPSNVEPFSPKQAMEQLSKKIDTTIKFFQVHEKEKLAPLLEELNITNRRLSVNLEHSVTKTDLKKIEDQVIEVKEKLAQLILIQKEIIDFLNKSEKRNSANHADLMKGSHNLILMMELLFEAFITKGITGGVKQSLIDTFNNLKNAK